MASSVILHPYISGKTRGVRLCNVNVGLAAYAERKKSATLRILNGNDLNNGNDRNEQGVQVIGVRNVCHMDGWIPEE